jgi:hypothetical protein
MKKFETKICESIREVREAGLEGWELRGVFEHQSGKREFICQREIPFEETITEYEKEAYGKYVEENCATSILLSLQEWVRARRRFGEGVEKSPEKNSEEKQEGSIIWKVVQIQKEFEENMQKLWTLIKKSIDGDKVVVEHWSSEKTGGVGMAINTGKSKKKPEEKTFSVPKDQADVVAECAGSKEKTKEGGWIKGFRLNHPRLKAELGPDGILVVDLWRSKADQRVKKAGTPEMFAFMDFLDKYDLEPGINIWVAAKRLIEERDELLKEKVELPKIPTMKEFVDFGMKWVEENVIIFNSLKGNRNNWLYSINKLLQNMYVRFYTMKHKK